MSGPPYRVKAIYAYSSEHDDDLKFPEGQIITVKEEEDDDWFFGEYNDDSGSHQQGLFPKNFVERYEPVTPPRPTRTTHARQPTDPVPAPPQPAEVAKSVAPVDPEPEAKPEPESEPEPEVEAEEDAEEDGDELVEPLAPAPLPVQASKPPPPPREVVSSPPMQATKPPPPPREAVVSPPSQATKPVPSPAQAIPESKPKSPPVAEKPSSFKDRIAAFNRGGAGAPQAPPKPGGIGGGPGSSGFVKKTYMAPPPSRNAYIPPTNSAPVAKIYRREEDPEFAKTETTETELPDAASKTEEPEEEQPKPMSLKERMALLQKQQLEQQSRHAEAVSKKAKPKPPPKKAAPPPQPRASADETAGAEMARETSRSSTILSERPVPAARVLSNDSAQAVASPEHAEANDFLTAPKDDATERSASEAGESVREEEAEEQEETGDNNGEKGEDEEEEDEEELDPEVRRRMEIRERMAKMSGGMGMGAMFGAPALPGMATRKSSKPKSSQPSGLTEDEDVASSPPQAIPVMPGMGMPLGMALPGMSLPRPTKPEPEVEQEVQRDNDADQESEPISKSRKPDEVPDIEDIKEQGEDEAEEERPAQPERVVPPRRDSRPLDELPTSPRAAPPVPTGSRPPRAPPPESRPSVDLSEQDSRSSIDRGAPPIPREGPREERGAPPPPPHVSSPPPPPSNPPMSIAEKRASRPPPPVPGAIDTSVGRAPPPPPPGQPPRARQSQDMPRPPPPVPSAAKSATSPAADDDYDPYNYESNPLGAPTPTGGRTPQLEGKSGPFSPPPPDDDDLYSSPSNVPQSPASRAPPPPPHGSAPRAVPPPVPPPAAYDDSEEEEEDESEEEEPAAVQNPAVGRKSEELHHAGLPSIGPEGRAPPPPPPGQAPMSPPSEHGGAPELSSSAPRSLPPRPPAIVAEPAHEPAPSRPSEPVPRKSYDGRKSLDVLGQTQARRSIDVPRPSADIGDYIATDVDLGQSSDWWTQRKAAPPALQGRSDILVDFEESTTMQGQTLITKHVYVLYMDYSQTVITARFTDTFPEVDLQQRHEPPPARLRQDQLEAAHSKIGTRLAAAAKNKENHVVGDGSSLALVQELLRSFPEALAPVGTRAFGAAVYANIGNASVLQHDEIRAGDIISFRNAKMQGHRGAMKQKYSMDMAEHVGVVVDWDGTKKKVRAWEQGRESKKVKVESFKLGDLRSGEVKIWRVMSKDWVGWGST